MSENHLTVEEAVAMAAYETLEENNPGLLKAITGFVNIGVNPPGVYVLAVQSGASPFMALLAEQAAVQCEKLKSKGE